MRRPLVLLGLALGLLAPGLLAPAAERGAGSEERAGEPVSRAWTRAAPIKLEPSLGSRSNAPVVLPAGSRAYEPQETGAAPYEPPALAPLAPETTPSSQRAPPATR